MANGMDRRMHGKPGAKIGFVAAGKNLARPDVGAGDPRHRRGRGPNGWG